MNGASTLAGPALKPAEGRVRFREHNDVPPGEREVALPAIESRIAGPACQKCGALARVRLLATYANGRPLHRKLCVSCFELHGNELPAAATASTRAGWRVLLALVGILLAAVGLLNDFVIPHAHPGFGWYQRIGVALAAVLLLAGVLFGAEVVALIGVLSLGGALSIDLFGFSQGPGIGWKQQVLIFVGGVCVAIGFSRRLIRALHARWITSRAERPVQQPS